MENTFKARIDKIICEKSNWFDVELSIKGINAEHIKKFMNLQGRNIFINVEEAEGSLNKER